MEAFIGTIIIWPSTLIPNGWLPCDGRRIEIRENTALFNILGFRYGGNSAGEWFALPDFRNVYIAGASDKAPIGTRSDSKDTKLKGTALTTFTISEKNLPAHSHEANFEQLVGPAGNSIDIAIPVDGLVTQSNGDHTPDNSMSLGRGFSGVATTVRNYSKGPSNTTLKPFKVNMPAVSARVTNKNTGEGEPVKATIQFTGEMEVKPPSISINFIICAHGTYPIFN